MNARPELPAAADFYAVSAYIINHASQEELTKSGGGLLLAQHYINATSMVEDYVGSTEGKKRKEAVSEVIKLTQGLVKLGDYNLACAVNVGLATFQDDIQAQNISQKKFIVEFNQEMETHNIQKKSLFIDKGKQIPFLAKDSNLVVIPPIVTVTARNLAEEESRYGDARMKISEAALSDNEKTRQLAIEKAKYEKALKTIFSPLLECKANIKVVDELVGQQLRLYDIAKDKANRAQQQENVAGEILKSWKHMDYPDNKEIKAAKNTLASNAKLIKAENEKGVDKSEAGIRKLLAENAQLEKQISDSVARREAALQPLKQLYYGHLARYIELSLPPKELMAMQEISRKLFGTTALSKILAMDINVANTKADKENKLEQLFISTIDKCQKELANKVLSYENISTAPDAAKKREKLEKDFSKTDFGYLRTRVTELGDQLHKDQMRGINTNAESAFSRSSIPDSSSESTAKKPSLIKLASNIIARSSSKAPSQNSTMQTSSRNSTQSDFESGIFTSSAVEPSSRKSIANEEISRVNKLLDEVLDRTMSPSSKNVTMDSMFTNAEESRVVANINTLFSQPFGVDPDKEYIDLDQQEKQNYERAELNAVVTILKYKNKIEDAAPQSDATLREEARKMIGEFTNKDERQFAEIDKLVRTGNASAAKGNSAVLEIDKVAGWIQSISEMTNVGVEKRKELLVRVQRYVDLWYIDRNKSGGNDQDFNLKKDLKEKALAAHRNATVTPTSTTKVEQSVESQPLPASAARNKQVESAGEPAASHEISPKRNKPLPVRPPDKMSMSVPTSAFADYKRTVDIKIQDAQGEKDDNKKESLYRKIELYINNIKSNLTQEQTMQLTGALKTAKDQNAKPALQVAGNAPGQVLHSSAALLAKRLHANNSSEAIHGLEEEIKSNHVTGKPTQSVAKPAETASADPTQTKTYAAVPSTRPRGLGNK